MSCRKVALAVLMVGAMFVVGSCAVGPRGPLVSHPVTTGWEDVVADDLSNCTFGLGSWTVEDRVLTRKGGGDIWTKARYGDFILDLEFKVDKGTNSGVFFRTANIKDPVQTGIEVQIYDSHGREKPGKHDCGAIYDVQAECQRRQARGRMEPPEHYGQGAEDQYRDERKADYRYGSG